MFQLITPGAPISLPNFFRLTDPRRGGQLLGTINYTTGGNPDLKPELSESVSSGVVLTPVFAPSLRLSVDWTRINKKNDITSVSLQQAQAAINSELSIPGIITRAAPVPGDPFGIGPITGINGALFNASRAKLVSYDLSASYLLTTASHGSWSLAAAATRLVHNDVQFSQGTSGIEQGDTQLSPAWNGNASVAWNYVRVGLTWTSRYLDSYWITPDHTVNTAQGSARVGSATYHDVDFSYKMDAGRRGAGAVVSRMEFHGGIKDLFNKSPRFLAGSFGSYDPWSDPRMRTYYLSASKAF
jgi:hypothetical protein